MQVTKDHGIRANGVCIRRLGGMDCSGRQWMRLCALYMCVLKSQDDGGIQGAGGGGGTAKDAFVPRRMYEMAASELSCFFLSAFFSQSKTTCGAEARFSGVADFSGST